MVVKGKHQWLEPQGTPKTEEVSGSGWFVDNKFLGDKLAQSDKLHIVTNGHVAIDALKSGAPSSPMPYDSSCTCVQMSRAISLGITVNS